MGTCLSSAKPKLRIMFFESGEYGGSVKSLVGMVLCLQKCGCEVSIFSHYRRTGPEDISSLDCVREKYCLDRPAGVRPRRETIRRTWGIPYLSWFGVEHLYAALRALYRSRPQVVYLNNGLREHLPAIVAARILGIPIICHLRGTWRFSPAEKLSIPHVRRFVALTRYGQQFFHEQGIPMDKLSQTHNPFDVLSFDARLREQSDVSLPADGSIYVVQVGTLREHKGPEIAVEALSHARKECPQIKLVLAGDGPMRDALEQKVREHRLSQSVLFAGQCHSVPALLVRCHIGLLLSRGEGQPNCVMEYMAARLPVIARAIPGIEELVVDGHNGVIVAEASPEACACAMVTLCRSPALRLKMGHAGRQVVTGEQFDPKTHGRQIRNLVTAVAQRT